MCTGLQLAEHLQDVGEDLGRGRVYLPVEDLARFGCSHGQLTRLASRGFSDLDLDGDHAGPPEPLDGCAGAAKRLGEAIEFEVGRARELLAAGVPLVRSVDGRPKLAVAAFVAGGRAALGEIERSRFQVLGGVRRASRAARVRALMSVLVES